MAYISRSLEPVIQRAVDEFPAVVLTGPRQSGKTTLLKHLFGARYRYQSMEPPDVQAAAREDPRGFLAMYAPPVILDEIQYAPQLLPYIKEFIDSRRDLPGQFLLTGSQNLLLLQSVSESLAGRAAILRLLPLSFRERLGRPQAPLPWENPSTTVAPSLSESELWGAFLQGGYPELVAGGARDETLWHSSYIQTYLERDVRTLRQVGDLGQFQTFIRALAARSAQLLNVTALARDLGLAVNTIKGWLSVLEASYQILILRPYHINIGKRLVKTPKVYFADTGTLCHLTGLRHSEHALHGPMGGALFETALVTEVYRTLAHRGQEPDLFFWRTATEVEVDLLVGGGEKLIPLEAKTASTPNRRMAKSLELFRADMGGKAGPGFIIHPGGIRLPVAPNVTAWPFGSL